MLLTKTGLLSYFRVIASVKSPKKLHNNTLIVGEGLKPSLAKTFQTLQK
jgi:hypothetical protein